MWTNYCFEMHMELLYIIYVQYYVEYDVKYLTD